MSDIDNKASHGILSLTIRDKNLLYAAYMPFLRNGGLFIPTNRSYQLGEEIFILLNLMDESARIPIAGKIVWITPRGAEGYRAHGIGVEFNDEDANATRARIENILAGGVDDLLPTHTM